PVPDPNKIFRSPQELLEAYPIVLMFRLGSKDRERFERRYLNNPDYEQFFEALVPNHREALKFFECQLKELEAEHLVRPRDGSMGRFAVVPVQGNTGDNLGEN